MERRQLFAAVSVAFLGAGAAAVTAVAPSLFPEHAQTIFWVGVVLVAAALVAISVILFWPTRRGKAEMTDKPKMPRNSGILIDSCRDALVEGNTVVGFDEGVTDIGSERSKIVHNRIYRKPPKKD
jgi:hypothetical protein